MFRCDSLIPFNIVFDCINNTFPWPFYRNHLWWVRVVLFGSRFFGTFGESYCGEKGLGMPGTTGTILLRNLRKPNGFAMMPSKTFTAVKVVTKIQFLFGPSAYIALLGLFMFWFWICCPEQRHNFDFEFFVQLLDRTIWQWHSNLRIWRGASWNISIYTTMHFHVQHQRIATTSQFQNAETLFIDDICDVIVPWNAVWKQPRTAVPNLDIVVWQVPLQCGVPVFYLWTTHRADTKHLCSSRCKMLESVSRDGVRTLKSVEVNVQTSKK